MERNCSWRYKKTLWNELYDIEELPQVLQPNSGFVYNTNHSPFKSTSNDENPKEEDFNKNMGYETFDNNRSVRLKSLIDSYDKVSFEDFKKIKYDNSFPDKFSYNFMDINLINEIELDKDHELYDMLNVIQNWDRKTDSDSIGAGLYGVFYYQLIYNYASEIRNLSAQDQPVSKEIILSALSDIKTYLMKYFGKTNITLGEFQKLTRGDKELPIWGLPDVITAMSSRPYRDGMVKVTAGESYIGLIRFTDKGPIMESIISYGNSDDPSSEHYTDQMERYSRFQTKKMTFDKKIIYTEAKKIYNPN